MSTKHDANFSWKWFQSKTQNCSDTELLYEQVTKRESFVEIIEESNLTLSKSLA